MSIVQDLLVAGRRYRQVRSSPSPLAVCEAERESLRDWFRRSFAALPSAPPLRGASLVELESSQPPWTDSGLDLEEGEWVTTCAAGRVVLSLPLDLWVGPQFQLWMRVGEDGQVFNGTRDTFSFRAAASGRLYFAGYLPGQWAEPNGRLATSINDYAAAKGGLTVAVFRWAGDPREGMAALAGRGEATGRLDDELVRLDADVREPPGWSYLWFVGRSEIFQPAEVDGRSCISCHTHRSAGILQHDAVLDFQPGTRLGWDWNVAALPSTLPENSALSHDYLSVAVEFENGRDITYTWSRELPVEYGYWCPLPTWKDREFHVVVRSGEAGLGTWIHEERDLYADYRRYMGEPPRRVVRVWLIAASVFQRLEGRALFRDFRLEGPGGRVAIG